MFENEREFESYLRRVRDLLVKAFGEMPSLPLISKLLPELKYLNIAEREFVITIFVMSDGPDLSRELQRLRKTYKNVPDVDIEQVIVDMKEAMPTVRSRVHAEAEDAPFGKYAFADERVGVVPPEPNNKLEKRIARVLEKWQYGDMKSFTPAIASVLQSILSKGLYTDVFERVKQEVVYRGMGVSSDYLKKALGLKSDEVLPDQGSENTHAFVFSPYKGRGASSWTPELSATERFSKQPSQEYHITMSARTDGSNSETFLGLTSDFYDTFTSGMFSEDREVLALAPVFVSEISWSKNENVHDDEDEWEQ